ncbi:MAG TPA: ribosome assembly factor SBDS [Thermoplasmata archaeon]|nr:ribosome assembly factor SBDS [Thermoplasmata archaeon]
MVKVEDAVVARWETGGSRFEVLVDPATVQAVKDGKPVDVAEGLALDQIFKDAKKGDKISDEYLEKVFHTRSVPEIAKQILLKGEVQVTTEQRHQLQEAKYRQIVAEIARNAMNPQTGAPHPPARIEAAMREAKVHVDPFRSAELQVPEVLQKLRPLLPIRLDSVKVKIKVRAQDYPKVIGDLKGFGKLSEESWLGDGSWTGVLQIPAGVQTDLYAKLNAKTKGTAETSLVTH